MEWNKWLLLRISWREEREKERERGLSVWLNGQREQWWWALGSFYLLSRRGEEGIMAWMIDGIIATSKWKQIAWKPMLVWCSNMTLCLSSLLIRSPEKVGFPHHRFNESKSWFSVAWHILRNKIITSYRIIQQQFMNYTITCKFMNYLRIFN